MLTKAQQEFYFHADATSIGGYLEEPFRYIPTPSSVALSSAGGLAEDTAKGFAFEEGVKVASAYTMATGRPAPEGGAWTERVVSVVEGLDIFGMITADRLVAQMFIEQPAGGGMRKVTFAGSNVTNLRVNGAEVPVTIESSLVPTQTRTADAYNRDATFTPDVAWAALTDLARQQNAALLANKALPDWARQRYGSISQRDGSSSEGYTLCSLVNQIGAVNGGQTFGHCIELPDFGRICLAEMVVLPYSAHLTWVRAELTGKQCGRTICCMISTNGTTWPPN